MHEPSIRETAFSCPHCGAYTTQYWHCAFFQRLEKDTRTPFYPDSEFEKRITEDHNINEEIKEDILSWVTRLRFGEPFIHGKSSYSEYPVLENLFLSQCYNCEKWAVWVGEILVYPSDKAGSLPNQDLPDNIISIVDEARSIVNLSPKGAAALLRLSLQILCKHLGEPGKDLNRDIANLVSRGLNPTVQKALDIVRVIGNESVHPGVIDLNDDREIALSLFDLINIIAEQMITQPKHISELYETLPEGKRLDIEKRDSSTDPKVG